MLLADGRCQEVASPRNKRLIYGSNWPCTKHSGSYASFLKLVDSWISGKGAEAREDYYWRNSATAYRLPLK